MQKRIKSLLKDNIIYIALGVTISIAYLSLMRMPKIDIGYINSDKVYHLIAYFTLTICWLFSFYKKKGGIKYLIIIACVIYGIILEFLQQNATTYRTGDYLDAIANTTGVLLALVIFNQILKKKRVNS